MATKREHTTEDTSSSAKRPKMENGNGKLDAANNPYLAHWNDDSESRRVAPTYTLGGWILIQDLPTNIP